MEESLYRLVFKGEIQQEQSIQSVREKLSKLLHCDDGTLSHLLSGKSLVLKDKLDFNTAYKYKTEFETTGALCYIKKPQQASKKASARVTLICPKCGHKQKEAECCVCCGVVIEKFLQRQSPDQASSLSQENQGVVPSEDEKEQEQSAPEDLSPKGLNQSFTSKFAFTLGLAGLLLFGALYLYFG